MDIKPSLFRVNFTPKELAEIQKEIPKLQEGLNEIFEEGIDAAFPVLSQLMNCIAKQAPV